MHKSCARMIAASVSASMIATPVLAKSADSLQDLVGARGAGGETQLESRGFEHIKTVEEDSAKLSYWWNSSKKDCVRVRTYDGRYTAIVDVSDKDCDKKASGKGAAVAAAAVGALAIGALLLSRKSKDRNKDHGYEQEWQQVEVHGTQSGTLRIFEGPSTSERVIDRVESGTLLRNHGCDDYGREVWCEISTMDGRVNGWARDRFLRVSSAGAGHYPSYETERGQLVEVHGLNSGSLRIMSEPSKNDTVIGRVNRGAKLRRMDCHFVNGEDWCRVATLDGRMHGWARERYLRPVSGAGHYPSHGGGTYGSIAGIRGMSGVEAFDELRSRGFENVDSFSSGRTLYGIYYFRPEKLCVQTTSSRGRVSDIRDIRTHPKCR